MIYRAVAMHEHGLRSILENKTEQGQAVCLRESVEVHYSVPISRVLSLDSHSSSNMITHAVKQPTRIQCEPH